MRCLYIQGLEAQWRLGDLPELPDEEAVREVTNDGHLQDHLKPTNTPVCGVCVIQA